MKTSQVQRAGRTYIEDEVAARTLHPSMEDVRTTCSFARAERLLGREYHRPLPDRASPERSRRLEDGRSIRSAGLTSARSRCRGTRIARGERGFGDDGRSCHRNAWPHRGGTKTEGEAIGHKGIGFKSVLEVSLTPEVYSGLQTGQPALAVGFDPMGALESIRHVTDEMGRDARPGPRDRPRG